MYEFPWTSGNFRDSLASGYFGVICELNGIAAGYAIQMYVIDEAHREELQELRASFERDKDRMKEYCRELEELGIELKDARAGLIDFPCWMDGHEVYLCWRLGEPEVAYWHELEAGFAGRQKLLVKAVSK